jgi:sensor histidine kinase regulating citrate/malate metabolism
MERSDNNLNSDTSYAIKVLQQYRHDWMNHLQMLYAYGQLQRWDQLMNAIKQIIETSELEKKIFQIGFDDVVLFLMTNMYKYPQIQLNVEVKRAEDSSLKSKTCPSLKNGFSQLFHVVQECLREFPNSFVTVCLSFHEKNDAYNIKVTINSGQQTQDHINHCKIIERVAAWVEQDEEMMNIWRADFTNQLNSQFELSAKFDMIHECMMHVEK